MPLVGLDSEFDVPYTVICDSLNDNPATIIQSGFLPNRFDAHPDNAFATVRRCPIHREKNAPLVWRAVVHYSAVPLTQQEENQEISPLDRPARISLVATPYQVPVTFGEGFESNGLIPPTYHKVQVPIVNSAGDLPDPIPEKTDYYWVANVTKNIPLTLPAWIFDDYAGAINDSPYMIRGQSIPAENSRLIDLRVSEDMKEGNVRFCQLMFSLEFRGRREQRTDIQGKPLVIGTRTGGTGIKIPVADQPPPPFNLELVDMGLHKLVPAVLDVNGVVVTPAVRTRFMTDDATPRPVSQPILMNGAGDKLTDPTPYKAVFGNWRILKSKDFSVLPLT